MSLAMHTALLQSAETGVRESLRLADLPALWVVVLVILPLCLLISWGSYRGESLSPAARAVLVGLRFLALVTLCFVLFRPVRVERREEVQKAEVVVLVDDSGSMLRKDSYAGNEPLRAAVRALTERAEPGELARKDIAEALVEKRIAPGLARAGYSPRTFAFAESLSPQGQGGEDVALTGRGASTRIGEALSQVLASFRGHHLTDVVIVSDGRQTSGAPAQDAARGAALAGVQVHSVVIGDTRTERNARIELVEAPTHALEGDEISVTVRVLARGAQGEGRAQVTLEETTGASDSARVVAEEDVELSESGSRVTLVARPASADARTQERRFRVSIPPLENEPLLDDNALEFSVHITPEKVRVLYVDGYPRYEYRFLKELLKRADANIEVHCYLVSATPGWPQEATRGAPALQEVPTDRRALLDEYDVVVLGDVNPYAISPDPARCEEFLKNLREFVERGGGLMWIAGEYDNPRAFLNTPLEDLMPVVIEPSEAQGFQGDTTRGFRPLIEDPANPHEIVRLLGDAEQNRALWEEDGGLEGQFWYWPVTRAKPGSQVLLRHPTDGAHGERYPLLVAGYFPAGRTLFLALDSTWRWRWFHIGQHERFWRNAVRWLALGRLKSGDRRWRLEVARTSYNLGERVAVEARVLDEDYRPSDAAVQDSRWSDPEGKENELKLGAVPGKSGLFRGTFEAGRLGLYRVWMEKDGQRIANAEFEVVLPSLENQDPSPDPVLLRELATLSGARSVDLAGVGELLAQFPGGEERREPISSRLDDVWDRWATLLFALAVFALEWLLRKRFDLV